MLRGWWWDGSTQRWEEDWKKETETCPKCQLFQDLKKRGSHTCDMQALRPLPVPTTTTTATSAMSTSGGQPPLTETAWVEISDQTVPPPPTPPPQPQPSPIRYWLSPTTITTTTSTTTTTNEPPSSSARSKDIRMSNWPCFNGEPTILIHHLLRFAGLSLHPYFPGGRYRDFLHSHGDTQRADVTLVPLCFVIRVHKYFCHLSTS